MDDHFNVIVINRKRDCEEDERDGDIRPKTFGAFEMGARVGSGRESEAAGRLLAKGLAEQRRRPPGLDHLFKENRLA